MWLFRIPAKALRLSAAAAFNAAVLAGGLIALALILSIPGQPIDG